VRPVSLAIVAACPYPTWQGSQVLIRQMSDSLSQRGHKVHLITYGYGEYDLEPDYRLHRIPDLPFGHSLRSGPSLLKVLLDGFLAIQLFRVALKERIDIIHAHNYEALFASFPVAGLLNIPLVYHSHTILSKELHTYFTSAFARGLARKFALLIDRLALRLANHFIAVSEDELKFFTSMGKKETEFSCIIPGIVIEEHGHEPVDVEEGSICYMGNLDNYQDIETLFGAVRLVADEMESAKLTVVTRSDWSNYHPLIDRKGLSDFVRFVRPGTFAEAVNILKASSVAVSTRNIPSGFPIKLLNYMSCGKAIVATESSGKILQDGDTALIVDDNDPAAFAKAIIRLLKDDSLRSEIGQRVLELAASRCNWNNSTAQLERLYERLLKEKEALQTA